MAGGRPAGLDDAQWAAARAAHAGYQAGTELLALLPMVALDTGFYRSQGQ